MAQSGKGGSATTRRLRDKHRAAVMKRLGICRVTQRCPVCYRIVACESWKSSYTHICK